jgi:hypothetical protein
MTLYTQKHNIPFQIDEQDLELVQSYTWHVSDGYVSSNVKKPNGTWKRLKLHRLLMNPGKMQVDHINNDKTDNRRNNLRLCTQAENVRNASKYSSNTSGVIGVCWHKQHKKWAAVIRLNRKATHLGLFDDLAEAAHVRDAAAKQLHGEFAKLNQIPCLSSWDRRSSS